MECDIKMGVKMTETKTEIYLCKCGRDYITLEKSVNSRLRSSIKKIIVLLFHVLSVWA